MCDDRRFSTLGEPNVSRKNNNVRMAQNVNVQDLLTPVVLEVAMLW